MQCQLESAYWHDIRRMTLGYHARGPITPVDRFQTKACVATFTPLQCFQVRSRVGREKAAVSTERIHGPRQVFCKQTVVLAHLEVIHSPQDLDSSLYLSLSEEESLCGMDHQIPVDNLGVPNRS